MGLRRAGEFCLPGDSARHFDCVFHHLDTGRQHRDDNSRYGLQRVQLGFGSGPRLRWRLAAACYVGKNICYPRLYPRIIERAGHLLAPGLIAPIGIDARAIGRIGGRRAWLHQRNCRGRARCHEALWRYRIYPRHKFIHGTTIIGCV